MYILNEDLFDDLSIMSSEIPNVKTEVVTDSEIQLKGPESGLDNGIANILHDLIIDENEAIQKYNNAIANLESRPEIIPIIQDITNDGMNHIGMLEVALELLSPNAKNIEEGEVAAENELETTMSESLNEATQKTRRSTVAVDPVGITAEELNSGAKSSAWEQEKNPDTLEDAFQYLLSHKYDDLEINWHWLSANENVDKISPIFKRIHSLDELVPDVVVGRFKREVFINEYVDNLFWKKGDTTNIENALNNGDVVIQFAGYMRKAPPSSPRTRSNPQGGEAIGKNKELGEDLMVEDNEFVVDGEMKHMMVDFLAKHHKNDNVYESLYEEATCTCSKCGEKFPLIVMESVGKDFVCGFCMEDEHFDESLNTVSESDSRKDSTAIFNTKMITDKDRNGQKVVIKQEDSNSKSGKVLVQFPDGVEKWVYKQELDYNVSEKLFNKKPILDLDGGSEDVKNAKDAASKLKELNDTLKNSSAVKGTNIKK